MNDVFVLLQYYVMTEEGEPYFPSLRLAEEDDDYSLELVTHLRHHGAFQTLVDAQNEARQLTPSEWALPHWVQRDESTVFDIEFPSAQSIWLSQESCGGFAIVETTLR